MADFNEEIVCEHCVFFEEFDDELGLCKRKAPVPLDGDGGRFRKDRPSYEQMKNFAMNQDDTFDYSDETIACYCGD